MSYTDEEVAELKGVLMRAKATMGEWDSVARAAMRWRDETRPQQPAALAVPATMADGWRHDICATLNRVMPSWIAAGKTPIEAACNAIEALAAVACEAHDRPAAAVPEGYVLVPVEPTTHMLRAAQAAWTPGVSDLEAHAIRYRAMLAAAERKGEQP